jgi:Tfp pilus assembly PilM family ATPase
MAQLATYGEEIKIVGYNAITGVAHDPPDGPQWQRWAIKALRYARANGQFRGIDAVVALPPSGLFIDHVAYPGKVQGKPEDAIFAKIERKIPTGWTRDSVITKCVPTEQDKAMVMAVPRVTIDRQLAIYERARLRVKSIAVWPTAMATCYARLFGQHVRDRDAVVMLVDIQPNGTNLVICRGENPLFASSIPLGIRQICEPGDTGRLVRELHLSAKQHMSLYRDADIERLVFLSVSQVTPEIGRALGAELGVPVQLANCQVALGIESPTATDSNGDPMQASWTVACGLSLC